MDNLRKNGSKPQKELGRGAVPVDKHDKINRVRILAGKSVCSIHLANDDLGSGAFYKVIDNRGGERFLVMTCHHVLPTTSTLRISQVQFKFYDIPQMKCITLDKTQVKNVWTEDILDATVIELYPEIASLYKSYGAEFLQIGEVKPNVDVVILQYPWGIFSIADGDIEEVNRNGTRLFYRIGTESGSSGSPLLDLDCVALGMHNTGQTGVSSREPNAFRVATALSAIVLAYLGDRPNDEPNTRILKYYFFLYVS